MPERVLFFAHSQLYSLLCSFFLSFLLPLRSSVAVAVMVVVAPRVAGSGRSQSESAAQRDSPGGGVSQNFARSFVRSVVVVVVKATSAVLPPSELTLAFAVRIVVVFPLQQIAVCGLGTRTTRGPRRRREDSGGAPVGKGSDRAVPPGLGDDIALGGMVVVVALSVEKAARADWLAVGWVSVPLLLRLSYNPFIPRYLPRKARAALPPACQAPRHSERAVSLPFAD